MNEFLDMVAMVRPGGRTAFNMIAMLVLAWGMIRVVNQAGNPVEWWHFFASKNQSDGKEYGDPNKLGLLVGIIFSTWVIVNKLDYTESTSVWIFGFWLVFISGAEAFSQWARTLISKRYESGAPPPLPASVSVTATATSTPVEAKP